MPKSTRREFLSRVITLSSILYCKFSFSNIESEIPRNGFLGVFFESNSSPNIFFVTSKDGVVFKKLTLTHSDKLRGRDPNLFHFKGYWYISHTGVNRDNFKLNKSFGDFTILRSKDLISWDEFRIPAYRERNLRGLAGNVLSGNINKIDSVWAPNFLLANGDVYIVISIGNRTAAKLHGAKGELFSSAMMKCNNLSTLTFNKPIVFLEDANDSFIDTQVLQFNSNEFFAVTKSEINGDILIFKSNNVSSGYVKISTIPFRKLYGFMVEAPNLVWNSLSSCWFLYLDRPTKDKDYYFCISKDLVNWSEPHKIDNSFDMRHGNIINV